MKRSRFKEYALIGVSSALAIASSVEASSDAAICQNDCSGKKTLAGSSCSGKSGCSNSSIPQPMMTEQELMAQLDPQGKAIYNSMNQDGKTLALKLASQACRGLNDCQGLNSCKTNLNACKGQGSCKGMSPGPFMDKNDAVAVASAYMQKKKTVMQ